MFSILCFTIQQKNAHGGRHAEAWRDRVPSFNRDIILKCVKSMYSWCWIFQLWRITPFQFFPCTLNISVSNEKKQGLSQIIRVQLEEDTFDES